MKKKLELDVDFIGGQEPLTVEEEKALSDFFRQRKLASSKHGTSRKHLGYAKRIKSTN